MKNITQLKISTLVVLGSIILCGCGSLAATPVPTLVASPVTSAARPTPIITPTVTVPGLAIVTLSASDPSAAQLLNQTSTAFAQLQSLHLHLEIRQGKVQVSGQQIKLVEGDIAKPDKYQAQVKVGTFLGDFSLPVIGVGGQQYMKNEFGGWGQSDTQATVNLAVLLDAQQGLAPTMLKMQNVQLLDKEIGVAGANGLTYHLQGEATATDIRPLTFNKLGQHNATLDFWIDNSTSPPQILQFYLKEVGTDSDLNFWAMNFSKFNEQIQIQKPS